MASILDEKRTFDPQTRDTGGRAAPAAETLGHEETIRPEDLYEDRPVRTLIRGSTAEGVAAGAAVVLSILGLAGVMPETMLSIATLGVAAALLFEGAAIASRFSTLLRQASHDMAERLEFEGGLTAEFFAGAAGLVLGVLALTGVAATTLVSGAVLVFGAALLLGGGVMDRLNHWHIGQTGESAAYRDIARQVVSAATGVQMLVGLGVIALGILALTGPSALTLSLVAMLAAGFAITLSSTALCTRLMSFLRH